jgi:hypothetical protein
MMMMDWHQWHRRFAAETCCLAATRIGLADMSADTPATVGASLPNIKQIPLSETVNIYRREFNADKAPAAATSQTVSGKTFNMARRPSLVLV